MTSRLKEISIEHFRGFNSRQTVGTSLPNGKEGSGLTIVVGENNTGKSIIFEAIKKMRINAKFLPKERNGGDPVIEFVGQSGKVTRVARGKKANVTVEDGEIKIEHFELIPSRRHWQHNFHSQNVSNYSQYCSLSISHDSQYTADGNLGGLLEKIAVNPEQKTKFDQLMKSLIPSFSNWEVDTDDQAQDVVRYQTAQSHWHDTSLVGDGLISLFRICAQLVSTSHNLILCIDEPELSLSPITQKNLARLLSTHSKDKQIIISTHCPHFVRWQDILAGAKIYRSNKTVEGCEIRSLNSNSTHFQKIVSAFDDWQKPHVLDSVAKEIFFSDRVLFLEGQEDVGLVKKYMHDKNMRCGYEIFGYGCGGSGNIQHFFALCRDLGIKAAALFDWNAPGLAEAQKLSDFKSVVHKYEDIRVKAAKTGLFESNGSIDSQKALELDGHLDEIGKFFDS